jgi:hypothetical protein
MSRSVLRNVRWAAFPNDPGVGFRTSAAEYYNANTGTRLDVEFVTAKQRTPARLIAAIYGRQLQRLIPLVIDSAVQTPCLTNPIQARPSA